MQYTITVTEYFARDHWNRGCLNTDKRWEDFVTKRQGNRVTLNLTAEQVRGLHDDADYYATSPSYRYQEMLGLVSSARATRNTIRKQHPQLINN
jgi:hypothetical protein